MKKRFCRVCGSNSVLEMMNFGKQPISTHFLSSPSKKEVLYPLILGQCEKCSVVQIINPIPIYKRKPPYPWLTYKEPEKHLTSLVEVISRLKGVNKKSVICGLSYKDKSILERLRRMGFKYVWLIDLGDKFQILDEETVNKVLKRYRKVDVVIARHILEHTNDAIEFISNLKRLITPRGYIIIEVPDYAKALERYDYSVLWEEHTLYFTPKTFYNFFAINDLSVVYFKSCPYPLENSLIGIAQKACKISFISEETLIQERQRVRKYVENFLVKRRKIKKFISELRKQGKIVMFGAGHFACTFLNLMKLGKYIEFVVDDNPNKQGLYMSGSRLPILDSSYLVKRNIKFCFLCVNPEVEEKIVQSNKEFVKCGGKFLSIFPVSKKWLLKRIGW